MDTVSRAVQGGRARFELVDSLRAVAALAVLVSHVSLASGYDASARGLTHRLNVGVAIFFAISGFVLYRPYVAARRGSAAPPRLRTYALRRAVRIVPAYWLALTLLAIWPGIDGVFSHRAWVFYGFAQIYDGLAHGGGMFTAWTLCVEVTFYAFLPLFALAITRLARRYGDVRADVAGLSALMAAALIWRTLFFAAGLNHASEFSWTQLVSDFDWFVPGMALAVISVHRAERSEGPAISARSAALMWAGALAAFALLWGVMDDPYASLASGQVNALLYGSCAVLLLAPAGLGIRRGLLRAALGWPVLLWLGSISYGIYLWHYPLAFAFHRRLGSPLATFLATAAATIACAALSFYLLERPLMRRVRSSRARHHTELAGAAPRSADGVLLEQ